MGNLTRTGRHRRPGFQANLCRSELARSTHQSSSMIKQSHDLAQCCPHHLRTNNAWRAFEARNKDQKTGHWPPHFTDDPIFSRARRMEGRKNRINTQASESEIPDLAQLCPHQQRANNACRVFEGRNQDQQTGPLATLISLMAKFPPELGGWKIRTWADGRKGDQNTGI